MNSLENSTTQRVRPNRVTMIVGVLLLLIAVGFFTWKSGVLTTSASTVPAKLTSQDAKQYCINQFASTFPDDHTKVTGVVTQHSVVLISEISLRGGWLVTLMNRPTNVGWYCSMGGGGGESGPVGSVPPGQSFGIEQLYLDNYGHTAQFGYVIHARSTISSVRAILATGAVVSARTRDGFATIVIAGTFRSPGLFKTPVGELVGFNQQGQVVATHPLGI